jgi:hypothetical protein
MLHRASSTTSIQFFGSTPMSSFILDPPPPEQIGLPKLGRFQIIHAPPRLLDHTNPVFWLIADEFI